VRIASERRSTTNSSPDAAPARSIGPSPAATFGSVTRRAPRRGASAPERALDRRPHLALAAAIGHERDALRLAERQARHAPPHRRCARDAFEDTRGGRRDERVARQRERAHRARLVARGNRLGGHAVGRLDPVQPDLGRREQRAAVEHEIVYGTARQHALERTADRPERDTALAAHRDAVRSGIERDRFGGAIDARRRFERQPARGGSGSGRGDRREERRCKGAASRARVEHAQRQSKRRAAARPRATGVVPRGCGRRRALPARARDRALTNDANPRTHTALA
jgi:hypothetical protein